MTDHSVSNEDGNARTSSTLLERIKSRDQDAWRRFVLLYRPLIEYWGRRFGLQDADLEDVTQDVFRTVSESIENFHHDPKEGGFRPWLRAVTRTRIMDFLRTRAQEPPGVGGSEAQTRLLEHPGLQADSDTSDDDERRLLIRHAVDTVLDSCKQESRQAFLRVVIAGHRAADVAKDLGMTVNAVYLAKSHILRRLREDYAQLLEI